MKKQDNPYKHQTEFDYYYKLGNHRSYRLVAEQFKKTERTINRWAQDENWQFRVQQRDIDIAKEDEKRVIEEVLDEKARARKDIKAQTDMLRIEISSILKQIKESKGAAFFQVKNIYEFNQLTLIYERLTKLDLLLVGEDTERATYEIKLPEDITEDEI